MQYDPYYGREAIYIAGPECFYLNGYPHWNALRARAEKKEPFPDLSPAALAAAYPGRCQSMTQVLSTADARMNSLTER